MNDLDQNDRAFFTAPGAAAIIGQEKSTQTPMLIREALKPRVPDHELLRIVGQGAYGEVWLARNVFGEYRAVKVVWRRAFGEEARPFHREFEGIKLFEPLSRSHPSQLAILHVGKNEEDGYFYYSMELADDAGTSIQEKIPVTGSSALSSGMRLPGSRIRDPNSYVPRTLRHVMRSRPVLSIAESLQIAHTLAAALSHLHIQGLVHRDIKPSNVVFVGGVPKLADIGLVSGVDDSRSFVGTEGYVPPEGPGTPSADCYGLGKLIYEMTSGRDRNAWPEPPADLATRPDRLLLLEFNAIIHRACAPELRARYPNAQAMLADLDLLRGGKSVKQQRLRNRYWGVCKKVGLTVLLLGLALPMVPRLLRQKADIYAQSSDPEVNKLVEQGFYITRVETPERLQYAESCFRQALNRDPKFVPALFGLVSVYCHQDVDDEPRMRNLRATAQMLKEAGPNSAEAVQTGAFIKWREGKYREALAEGKRATQLPAACRDGRVWSHGGYGFFLQGFGDAEGAREQYRLAEKIAYDEPTIQDHLGHTYFMRSNLVEALQHYEASIRLVPEHLNGRFFKARTLEEMGRFREAIQEFKQHDVLEGGNPTTVNAFYEGLLDAFNQRGPKGYWNQRLTGALNESPQGLYYIARTYAHLGKMDEAYHYLNLARDAHYCLEELLVDLCWDHRDERFRKIVKEVGLTL